MCVAGLHLEQGYIWSRDIPGAELHLQQKHTWSRGASRAEIHLGQRYTWNRDAPGAEIHLEHGAACAQNLSIQSLQTPRPLCFV